jgi:predicted nucleic acid-binding protein
VLRRHEMHGEITRARAITAFNSLHGAPALRRAQIRPLMPDAWGLRHNLTIADALYVALATRLHATLLTGDLKLAAAVSIPTITP